MAQKEKIKKALFDSNPWWRQKLEINYKDREIYQKPDCAVANSR